jgi:formate dehydrogenase
MNENKNIICVLYDDPINGYPNQYPRDSIPTLNRYPDGQSMPSPKSIDFIPGKLLGSVSGELGLRKFVEKNGYNFIVTSDKDKNNSIFDQNLHNAEIVISQPFWPAYLTEERIKKSPNLKLAITAGIGSDHVDLDAAAKAGITVCEVTYCNSISVAEHTVMMILSLVRNYIPQYKYITEHKGWNIADCVSRSYDVEGMNIGCIAAGRIGLAVLKRLKPFDVKLHYTDKHRLSIDIERELGLTYHANVESLVKNCDIVSIHCPLHPETEGLFNDELINTMKNGSYIINTARANICVRDSIVKALESGKLAGYAGDVWFPQPPSKDHVWRTMPNHAMTPHTSGSTLSAQARYAAGVREILECWFNNQKIRSEYLILDNGDLAGTGLHSYTINKK